MAKTQTAEQIVTRLQGKGYTPTQVVNSVARSLAHVERNVKNPVTKAVWRKADSLAKINMTKAYVNAGPGGIPCDPRCMDAHETHCECLCGGVNHGHSAH